MLRLTGVRVVLICAKALCRGSVHIHVLSLHNNWCRGLLISASRGMNLLKWFTILIKHWKSFTFWEGETLIWLVCLLGQHVFPVRQWWWKISGAQHMPKGRQLKQYRPDGVTNVVSSFDSSPKGDLPASAVSIKFGEVPTFSQLGKALVDRRHRMHFLLNSLV